jgi:hypothetical protein
LLARSFDVRGLKMELVEQGAGVRLDETKARSRDDQRRGKLEKLIEGSKLGVVAHFRRPPHVCGGGKKQVLNDGTQQSRAAEPEGLSL